MDTHTLAAWNHTLNTQDFVYSTEDRYDTTQPMHPRTAAAGTDTRAGWGTEYHYDQSHLGQTAQFYASQDHPHSHSNTRQYHAVHAHPSSPYGYHNHTPDHPQPNPADLYAFGAAGQSGAVKRENSGVYGGGYMPPSHTSTHSSYYTYLQSISQETLPAPRKKSWGTVPSSRGSTPPGTYATAGLSPSPEHDDNTWVEWNWGWNWKGAAQDTEKRKARSTYSSFEASSSTAYRY
ncbi:hypothetical protein V5O48_008943 [Marasmius crinis-equi]|uniref:Uncharacterized protein n=1 Tax=Marasmius crinis-equi TaxID=585013 RepID=A0ABR3FCH3_9AGAR